MSAPTNENARREPSVPTTPPRREDCTASADPWQETTCPICGSLARRRDDVEGGPLLSCAACATLRPCDDVARHVERLALAAALDGRRDLGPEPTERRLLGIALLLLRKSVPGDVAAELLAAWAAIRKLPALAAEALLDRAAGAELARLGGSR